MFKKEVKYISGMLHIENKTFETSDIVIDEKDCVIDYITTREEIEVPWSFAPQVARAILRKEGTLMRLGERYWWKCSYGLKREKKSAGDTLVWIG